MRLPYALLPAAAAAALISAPARADLPPDANAWNVFAGAPLVDQGLTFRPVVVLELRQRGAFGGMIQLQGDFEEIDPSEWQVQLWSYYEARPGVKVWLGFVYKS